MDVKVDAPMFKRLLMESPFFLLASLVIIIFALPAKADPPADHDLNADYPFRKVDVLQGDIFTIFFGSNVKNLSANCQSLTQNSSFYLSISTAYEEPHLGFYESYWGRGISLREYFVKHAFFSRHTGKWMIIIPLESHGSISPSRFPRLILPTSVNLILLLAIWLLMFYVNSFAFLDTYFRSKREKVSYGRWIIIGLMMLISIYLAYQVYVFLTFQE